jgi:hypothetical protein
VEVSEGRGVGVTVGVIVWVGVGDGTTVSVIVGVEVPAGVVGRMWVDIGVTVDVGRVASGVTGEHPMSSRHIKTKQREFLIDRPGFMRG